MAKFLTTTAGSHYLEQIILTAKNQVVLVSPYLKFSKTLFERLIDTQKRAIKIIIIYGKSELNHLEKQKILGLDNVTLYFFENLHAKCYFNESKMVITSMNIYEFSEKNNREMGVLLTRKDDLNAFTQAYSEANSIMKNAKIESVKPRIKTSEDGYCLRCLSKVKLNPLRPLCLKCFRRWKRFDNPAYVEKYCHGCGCETNSAMNTPLCIACKRANH
jgi:phosphatidylserine/phosphatidylglycerophosphate/cardiolipin synthase-like enzyme